MKTFFIALFLLIVSGRAQAQNLTFFVGSNGFGVTLSSNALYPLGVQQTSYANYTDPYMLGRYTLNTVNNRNNILLNYPYPNYYVYPQSQTIYDKPSGAVIQYLYYTPSFGF